MQYRGRHGWARVQCPSTRHGLEVERTLYRSAWAEVRWLLERMQARSSDGRMSACANKRSRGQRVITKQQHAGPHVAGSSQVGQLALLDSQCRGGVRSGWSVAQSLHGLQRALLQGLPPVLALLDGGRGNSRLLPLASGDGCLGLALGGGWGSRVGSSAVAVRVSAALQAQQGEGERPS